MYDKILDFIEDHRILVISGFLLIIGFIICLFIRSHNLEKKELEAQQAAIQASIEAEQASLSALEQDVVEPEQPKGEYKNNLGLDKDKDKDERIDIIETTAKPEIVVTPEQTEPTYPVAIDVWDYHSVPDKNVDGSSCKTYLSKVTLGDFGTFWGTDLTEDDFKGNERYLIGVKQNPHDYLKGDLQSVGWLINNLETFEPNDAIKFTNLHVIGHLGDTHVAILCSYDWYSAFGMEDTLVLFEDISNTLTLDTFEAGDIFSATVFAHNIKVEEVNGQRVVVVQYDTF